MMCSHYFSLLHSLCDDCYIIKPNVMIELVKMLSKTSEELCSYSCWVFSWWMAGCDSDGCAWWFLHHPCPASYVCACHLMSKHSLKSLRWLATRAFSAVLVPSGTARHLRGIWEGERCPLRDDSWVCGPQIETKQTFGAYSNLLGPFFLTYS